MELSEVIKKRRSTRQFTEDGVSGDEIMKMLGAALAAPNACNMQSWHFYVITDNSVKKRLADEKVLAAWATTAPVMFVACTDNARLTERFGERGGMFSVQDTALAMENLLLCAADLGLGGCFMGAFDTGKLKNILNIPEGLNPVAVVPVGKPATELPARPRDPMEMKVTFIGEPDGGYNKTETPFRKFEVRNSVLRESVFDNLDIRQSKYHDLNMSGSVFDDINISGTEFSDMNMKDCKFGGMTLEGSEFGCVEMTGCKFRNVVFDGAQFTNCTLKGAEFESCDFTDAVGNDGNNRK